MTKLLVFDLETSVGDKATHGPSAKDPDNDFFTVIYGRTPETVVIEHSEEGFKRQLPSKFIELLQDTDIIVGHNLAFDLSYVWHHPEIKKYLLRGGEIFDTQTCAYLDSGQRHSFASLGELQEIYLGKKVKLDRISKMYKRGIGADRMVGAQHKCKRFFAMYEQYSYDDGRTTLQIYEKQQIKLDKLGMRSIIKLYNKYLLSLIGCMNTGILIDTDKCQKTLREFKIKELELLEQAGELIKEYWNDERLPDFNVNSPTHKSAMLFGGEIKVKTRRENGFYKKIDFYIFTNTKNLAVRHFDTKKELLNALPDNFKEVLKSWPFEERDYESSDITIEAVHKKKYKLFDEVVDIKGFNLPLSFTKESKIAGRFGTGTDVIEKIYKRSEDEEAKEYCRLQKEAMNLHKMSSTYLEAFLNLNIDGRLYPNFNTTATSTSRLSSSNPNLQNVPSKSEMARAIQGLFIAPKGWKCFQFDYSQLEIYITAYLSGDAAMTKDLLSGIDFHCLRMSWCTSMAQGKSYEEIVDLAKKQGVKEWVLKRGQAKQISYQKAYGAGARSLAESTGLLEEDVKELMEKEDKIYYKVKGYNNHVAQTVENNTEYSTKQGIPSYLQRGGVNGKRFDSKGYELLPIKSTDSITYEEGLKREIGYYQSPTGKRYAFEQYGSFDRRGNLRVNFSPTQTRNYQVQGTANDVIGAAIAEMLPMLLQHSDKVQLINTVHDSVWLYVKDEYIQTIVPQVSEMMSDVPKIFKKYLNIEMPFAIPVDVETGNDFANLEPFIKEFKSADRGREES